MATVLVRPTNGVSFGYVYDLTAADVAAGTVTIDFQVDYALTAIVQINDSVSSEESEEGINDLTITFPANGQITIAEGTNLTFNAGHQLSIIANRQYA